jgi:hypothetical protein
MAYLDIMLILVGVRGTKRISGWLLVLLLSRSKRILSSLRLSRCLARLSIGHVGLLLLILNLGVVVLVHCQN